MKIMRTGIMSLVVFIPLFLSGCTAVPENIDEPVVAASLHKYLPSTEDLKEWTPSGRPDGYEGEDLYIYINGGADIYYRYGFEQVVVNEYRNVAGEAINLEIYEMKDDQAASGIYAFKTGTQGQAVDLGSGGMLEAYYLNFWKGKFLVTLTALDASGNSAPDLLMIARAVDARIPM